MKKSNKLRLKKQTERIIRHIGGAGSSKWALSFAPIVCATMAIADATKKNKNKNKDKDDGKDA
jgi:hypothetical protein